MQNTTTRAVKLKKETIDRERLGLGGGGAGGTTSATLNVTPVITTSSTSTSSGNIGNGRASLAGGPTTPTAASRNYSKPTKSLTAKRQSMG